MVSPEAAAWATVGGLGALALSRTMSVGSLTAAGTATLGAGLESTRRHDAVPFVFTALASTLVIVRHAANIRRIARGEEPQLSTRLWSTRH
jgi:glycerol-3-phosphate acyltransferase PlsY